MMRKIFTAATFLMLTMTSGIAFAASQPASMYVDSGEVFILSPTTSEDHIKHFNTSGVQDWDINVQAKVVEWSIDMSTVTVLSKKPYSSKQYIATYDRSSGAQLWQQQVNP